MKDARLLLCSGNKSRAFQSHVQVVILNGYLSSDLGRVVLRVCAGNSPRV